jgi:CHAD domain-containing protein
MTNPLPKPVLESRPAAEAVRIVALSHLDEAAAALPRLDEPGDEEALHDFRVALRRLRTVLRAYGPLAGEAGRKRVRRRLRRLARITTAGRDAEVQLAWLREREGELSAAERPGWRWLVARLESRRAEASEGRPVIRRAFAKLERRLRRQLGSYQLTIDLERGAGPAGPTFGAATAAAIHEELETLERRLSEASPAEPDVLHEARINAKRLRYVLEPVAGDGVLVERLKDLQDRLGELCDARVAQRELATGAETAAAERARALFDQALAEAAGAAVAPRRRDQRAGLIALARAARARWDRAYARLAAEWLEGRATPFVGDVRKLAERLAAVSPIPRSAADGRAPDADPWPKLPGVAHRRRRHRRAPRSPSGE